MSLLARSHSQTQKPQYKDYVTFLESYKNGKRDDQNSVMSSDSGINLPLSHSSSNSSILSDSVQKPAPTKPKQTVKTEMFIEIKSPPVIANSTKVFEVSNINNPSEATISVSSTAKMFENNSSSLKPKNSFSKKTKIEKITQKFENNSQSGQVTAKLPPKRAHSIGQVSKMFENESVVAANKPRNFNTVPKPFQNTTLPKNNLEHKEKPALSPRPLITSPKPTFVPQFPIPSPEPPKCYSDSTDSALSSLSISPSPPQSISPPPIAPSIPPPPPPPLPPVNFSSKPISATTVSKPVPIQTNHFTETALPSQENGHNGLVTPNGTLDRNDPRVKKAVYGALRTMYGAYHDQANDYLATLPKNRVKRNNGLDSIINSIASQGGLEKLTGRGNPNTEAE